jgi:hypothetical protein
MADLAAHCLIKIILPLTPAHRTQCVLPAVDRVRLHILNIKDQPLICVRETDQIVAAKAAVMAEHVMAMVGVVLVVIRVMVVMAATQLVMALHNLKMVLEAAVVAVLTILAITAAQAAAA